MIKLSEMDFIDHHPIKFCPICKEPIVELDCTTFLCKKCRIEFQIDWMFAIGKRK